MSYGKEGVKVLQQDYKDLKANPPKIEKTKDKNGDIFATMIYSNVVKDYIVVSEWSDLRMARKDLVVLKKDNKATLDKIKRLSMQESLDEGKKDYEIYHKSYTSATQEVIKYVEKNGYSIDFDDVWAQSVTFGRGKPSEGKTVRHKIPLLKNGKETKKYVNFQVYGLGNANNNRALNNYELNLYIS